MSACTDSDENSVFSVQLTNCTNKSYYFLTSLVEITAILCRLSPLLLPVVPEARPSLSSPRSDASSAFTVALTVMKYRSCNVWRTVYEGSLTHTQGRKLMVRLNMMWNGIQRQNKCRQNEEKAHLEANSQIQSFVTWEGDKTFVWSSGFHMWKSAQVCVLWLTTEELTYTPAKSQHGVVCDLSMKQTDGQAGR